jgi:hypothetical protein
MRKSPEEVAALEPVGDGTLTVYAWPDPPSVVQLGAYRVLSPAPADMRLGGPVWFFAGFVAATHVAAPLLLWLLLS